MGETIFQIKFEEGQNGTIHLATPEELNLLVAARNFISRVRWGENLDEASFNSGIEMEGQTAKKH